DQIEKVFKGVNEEIYRTTSGADLIAKLNGTEDWLLCSLIHKFGGKDEKGGKGGKDENGVKGFIEEMKRSIPPDFKAKG
ncbi:MAG TPA: hypothetical protein DHW02_17825, partial [Ktedonobacter sp.]|nr:hypothetical protein [Ktedonobacter sp.]